jgi:hypothetical protein
LSCKKIGLSTNAHPNLSNVDFNLFNAHLPIGEKIVNNLVGRFCLPISLKIVGHRSTMLQQKMLHQILNGVIEKTTALVTNKNQWTPVFAMNLFI